MKKVMSVLLAMVMLACLLPCFAVPVAADSLYIRKVVSVVYDDSGSMDPYTGAKWANANYAMQTFCGMLNSEDQLYISYMSEVEKAVKQNKDYTPHKVDLSSGGIQNSINTIRGHATNGNTPYETVRQAYEQLTQVQDTNPNTQYWLVIITDGAFNDGPMDKSLLDRYLNEYTNGSKKMANGTTPQITYMGIGNAVIMPTEKQNQGIFTYSASTANDIIAVMSDMAEKISGRTRVNSADVQVVNGNTVRVSSAIPLLNIAVLSQKSEAKVVSAGYTGENAIPISRQATLSFPSDKSLVGSACLVGNSQNVIVSGSYDITFDRAVDLSNVVVLFEPALETRMTISINGTPVTDFSELANAMEGDKISVSCKIYEMGTDNEIAPSLLPPGTKFQVLIRENGQQVVCEVGEEMELTDYTLKNIDTEVVAQVIIEGFKPIEYVEKFTPTPYVPRVVYTMDVAFVGGVKSVRLDNIATNKDLAMEFTVYADGVAMTNTAEVQALKPTVTASPSGNLGAITYSADGKIVYTPNAAPQPAIGTPHFDVQVTCTLDNGVTASATYTVLVALYEVFPLDVTGTIKKNEFYGNTLGASFYITKDGTRLTKAEVEAQAAGVLNEAYAHLDARVEVAPDGTITIIPHDPQEHKLGFWQWLGNWWWYFNLPKEDVSVTLSHAYGTCTTVIDVVEADTGYIIWNVVTPLVLEIALIAFLIWWIYAICAKPRFPSNAALYIGDLEYIQTRNGSYHAVYSFDEYPLEHYNKLRYYLAPTLKNREHHIAKGVVVSARHGGSLTCHCRVWFSGYIVPRKRTVQQFEHPIEVKRYVDENESFEIKTVTPTENADNIQAFTHIPCVSTDTYYVQTNQTELTAIESGAIFAYAYKQ